MTTRTRRPLTAHQWDDTVFLHWRRDPAAVESMLPPAVRPDVIDGSAWIGLVAYVFHATTVPPLPPPGPFGTLTEVTLEVLAVDDSGRRGLVYRTIETQHVAAILAARIGIGIPYRFAHAASRRRGGTIAHRSAAPRGGPSSAVRVRPADGVVTPTQRALANREGVIARRPGGRFTWWDRTHAPLALRPAVVEELRGDLPERYGMPGLFGAPPDSAQVAASTRVEYSYGGRVR